MSDPRTKLHTCHCGRQNERDDVCICETMKADELCVVVSFSGQPNVDLVWISLETKNHETLIRFEVEDIEEAVEMLNNFQKKVMINRNTYFVMSSSIYHAMSILGGYVK